MIRLALLATALLAGIYALRRIDRELDEAFVGGFGDPRTAGLANLVPHHETGNRL